MVITTLFRKALRIILKTKSILLRFNLRWTERGNKDTKEPVSKKHYLKGIFATAFAHSTKHISFRFFIYY